MLLQYINNFLAGWLIVPIPLALGLALLFGAIWLVGYWPPLFRRYWLWAVAFASAFLTLAAVAYVQIPLQIEAGQLLGRFWSQQVLFNWLLLAGIPQILLSGLVQEGAKMLPMVAWWWRSGRNLSPRLGLLIGAVAGAGFGIYEALWVLDQIVAAGIGLHSIQIGGFLAIAGYWERFFTVGFHIAVSALAGYGLARGMGWQFYLVASGLHALVNYSVVFLQSGVMDSVQVEIYIAAISVLLTAAMLWLRWRGTANPDGLD